MNNDDEVEHLIHDFHELTGYALLEMRLAAGMKQKRTGQTLRNFRKTICMIEKGKPQLYNRHHPSSAQGHERRHHHLYPLLLFHLHAKTTAHLQRQKISSYVSAINMIMTFPHYAIYLF